MTAGPINRALLESFFQSPGQIYDDAQTEGAFNVVANQTDENWFYLSDLVSNGSVTQTSNFLARQLLINGNFDIWQRGTVIDAGVTAVYSADRWLAWRTGLVTGMRVEQKTSSQINKQTFIAEIGRIVGNTSTAPINFAQALDSDTSTKFRGSRLSLTFQARAFTIADFSSAGKTVNVRIAYGTGQNQNASGSITGFTEVLNQTITLTDTFNTYSFSLASDLPQTVTQLFVYFSYTPTGTAGTFDNFHLSQVQLSATTAPISFQPKSAIQELEDCQAYTIAYTGTATSFAVGSGLASSTTVAPITVPLPVVMRQTPTLVATASDWVVNDGVTDTDTTSLVLAASRSSTKTVTINATVAAGLTQFRPYRLAADGTANRRLILDAEF